MIVTGDFMYYKDFAKIIKQKRKELGISSAEMADLLYISKSRYSKYENAHNEPSFEILCDIILLLDIDILKLIKKEKPKNLKFFD